MSDEDVYGGWGEPPPPEGVADPSAAPQEAAADAWGQPQPEASPDAPAGPQGPRQPLPAGLWVALGAAVGFGAAEVIRRLRGGKGKAA